MREQVLATRASVKPKWWAVMDAERRNLRNQTRWTEGQQSAAQRIRVYCQLYYHARGFYISWGRLGISIKVDQARVRDPAGLLEFERELEAQGVRKRVSDQGVIYRLTF